MKKNTKNEKIGTSGDELESAREALFGSEEGEAIDLPWYARTCHDPLIGVVVGVRRIRLKGENGPRDGLALVVRLAASCVLRVGESHEIVEPGAECGVTVGAKLATIAQDVVTSGPRVIRLQRGESSRLASGRQLATYDVRTLPISRSALPEAEKERHRARHAELMASLVGGRETALALAEGRQLAALPSAAPTIEEVPF